MTRYRFIVAAASLLVFLLLTSGPSEPLYPTDATDAFSLWQESPNGDGTPKCGNECMRRPHLWGTGPLAAFPAAADFQRPSVSPLRRVGPPRLLYLRPRTNFSDLIWSHGGGAACEALLAANPACAVATGHETAEDCVWRLGPDRWTAALPSRCTASKYWARLRQKASSGEVPARPSWQDTSSAWELRDALTQVQFPVIPNEDSRASQQSARQIRDIGNRTLSRRVSFAARLITDYDRAVAAAADAVHRENPGVMWFPGALEAEAEPRVPMPRPVPPALRAYAPLGPPRRCRHGWAHPFQFGQPRLGLAAQMAEWADPEPGCPGLEPDTVGGEAIPTGDSNAAVSAVTQGLQSAVAYLTGLVSGGKADGQQRSGRGRRGSVTAPYMTAGTSLKVLDFFPHLPFEFGIHEPRYALKVNDESFQSAVLRLSFFAFSHMRGGWDCGRHHDIMQAATLPFIPDLPWCGRGCLPAMPKVLLRLGAHTPGVQHIPEVSSVLDHGTLVVTENKYYRQSPQFGLRITLQRPGDMNNARFDRCFYDTVRARQRRHTSTITADSVMAAVLRRAQCETPRHVLIVSGRRPGYAGLTAIAGIADLGLRWSTTTPEMIVRLLLQRHAARAPNRTHAPHPPHSDERRNTSPGQTPGQGMRATRRHPSPGVPSHAEATMAELESHHRAQMYGGKALHGHGFGYTHRVRRGGFVRTYDGDDAASAIRRGVFDLVIFTAVEDGLPSASGWSAAAAMLRAVTAAHRVKWDAITNPPVGSPMRCGVGLDVGTHGAPCESATDEAEFGLGLRAVLRSNLTIPPRVAHDPDPSAPLGCRAPRPSPKPIPQSGTGVERSTATGGPVKEKGVREQSRGTFRAVVIDGTDVTRPAVETHAAANAVGAMLFVRELWTLDYFREQ